MAWWWRLYPRHVRRPPARLGHKRRHLSSISQANLRASKKIFSFVLFSFFFFFFYSIVRTHDDVAQRMSRIFLQRARHSASCAFAMRFAGTYAFVYRRSCVYAYTRVVFLFPLLLSLSFCLLSPPPLPSSSFPLYCVTYNEASNRARYAQSRRRLGRLRGGSTEGGKEKKKGKEKESSLVRETSVKNLRRVLTRRIFRRVNPAE